MQEFKKRRNLRGNLLGLGLRTLGVIALVGVAAVATRGAWGMYSKLTQASGAQEAAEAQLSSLELQKNQLSASVAALESSRGVEAEVRGRFGVVRPGEGVIEIVRDSATTSTGTAPQESFWQRVFRTLFVW